jgi:branched-chain amino acid transport system ATP-binding protein
VSVTFQGLAALSDVSMKVERGRVVGLIGPNGAGKTTLVNVLTGFQTPSHGQVILGSRISGQSAHRIRRIGIARTFQAGRLFAGLDVVDNLAISGVGLGHSRHASEVEALRILDWLQARHLRGLPTAGLPYTDERRVGIARALMFGPKFLLLDEPAAGMSESEANDLSKIVRRAATEFGCGVLLIEHNVSLVLSVSEHVYVLDSGRLIAEGDKATILRSAVVREAYLGSHAGEDEQ